MYSILNRCIEYLNFINEERDGHLIDATQLIKMNFTIQ